jgi:hypothetical protein
MAEIMSNHPNRSWRRVMNSAADAHLARYPWHDSGAYMMTPEQLRESLKTAYIAGYSEGRLALSTASKRKKGADHVYINGKKIELSSEAASYFVHYFLAATDAEQYGALCAIGLQEEARDVRIARENVKELTEIRAREQKPLGDDFIGSITFHPHRLDEKIEAAQDRLRKVSGCIGALLDSAKATLAAGRNS